MEPKVVYQEIIVNDKIEKVMNILKNVDDATVILERNSVKLKFSNGNEISLIYGNVDINIDGTNITINGHKEFVLSDHQIIVGKRIYYNKKTYDAEAFLQLVKNNIKSLIAELIAQI
jgi:hypothetical protein